MNINQSVIWVYISVLCNSSERLTVVGVHLLSVGEVDPSEERIVLGAGFACVILVQEHRRAAHFQSELLDALFVVHRQQEGLAALLRLHCSQDGKVLREHITWQVG